jgi:very-short-patch-repair endonuclease
MRCTDADDLILDLAHGQHGVCARWQLIAADLPPNLIDQRVKRRRLLRVGHCVYRVPGLDGPRWQLAAVVLSLGPHAVASHATAAELLGVSEPERPTSISVGRGRPDPRENVQIHRVRLGADECTRCDGIPVTTPARTLLDLAGRLSGRELEQVLARSFRMEIVTAEEVAALIDRYPRRPGAPRLRALLAPDTAPALTRSQAEEKFLALVRRAQLPEPRVNARLNEFEVDFLWRAHDVVVEIDGMAYHSSRAAQERDRRRDSTLAAAGLRLLRFTWSDLTKRPEATLAKVALALGRAGV